jgi:hypothetical protein
VTLIYQVSETKAHKQLQALMFTICHSSNVTEYLIIYTWCLINKGVAMIFCWGGPDFKPQTDDR